MDLLCLMSGSETNKSVAKTSFYPNWESNWGPKTLLIKPSLHTTILLISGLITATISSEVFRAAQPALLYLVPFTLLPLFTMAYIKVRLHLCHLGDGHPPRFYADWLSFWWCYAPPANNFHIHYWPNIHTLCCQICRPALYSHPSVKPRWTIRYSWGR